MNKISKTLITTLLMSLIASNSLVFANAGYKEYTAYRLPIAKGNNYTNTHAKTTNDTYIKNRVTSLAGTSAANFWAVAENHSAQSPKYEQRISSDPTKINFNNSSTLAHGQNVAMAMENHDLSRAKAFVSGEVDFR